MVAALNSALRKLPIWLVWLLGLVPLAFLILDTFTGALGVEPVRDIEHRLGRTALYFLIATLMVTPLQRFAGIRLMPFRRALGLISFTYALTHIAAWIVFDMAFLWGQILKDIVKRPYLIFGMLAFVMLLALALTSNRWSIRAMGRNWRRLHRLIYPAAILACLHWLWALKLWEPWPLTIFTTVIVLIPLRFWAIPVSWRAKGGRGHPQQGQAVKKP